ncbi:myosin-6-like protein [Carex littledalei]|uniref:Myosin-6-like protein n=1 Tax=Carex littledalei TaxID=544730 RepID=A0A833VU24_9POAL|nr:myosin-6-like protein [Carex littledalei]
MQLKKAAISTQCAWRVKVAKKELRKLKMASRETGVLQAAKNKLEKQVEDLTLRLQLERRMRSDAEEAKSQEIAKLKLAYQEMERHVKETKELLAKEKEVTKVASEKEVLVKEVPVVDTALVDKLTAENDNLKTVVTSLEVKVQETEKKYEESVKEAKEAESTIVALKNSVLSLQEKLSQMEAENQLLRKQALPSPARQTSQNGIPQLPPLKQEQLNFKGQTGERVIFYGSVIYSAIFVNYPLVTTNARYFLPLQESLEALINCVAHRVGVVPGKPIAAVTIYKCLLRWKSFEAEKTGVFDRVIQMIGSAFESPDNNDDLAFWLANSSTLAILLQKSLKMSTGSGSTPRNKLPPSTSFFGRMAQGFRASSASMSYEGSIVVRQVEAKQTAMLFKQQLQAFVETFYGMVRDNLRRELTSLLSLAIQAPRTAKASIVRGRSVKNSNLNSHWKTLVDNLNDFLEMLQENGVPTIVTRKLIGQTFSFINVQLFNSLLMRRECCSFSNGEYVKYGLEELEAWCGKAKEEASIIGSAWDELNHIRQAVGFLVIFQKYRVSYEDLTCDLCPELNVQQLHQICSQYWDDKYNTQSVSQDVLSKMNDEIETSDDTSNAFLLDDDDK